MVAHVPSIEEKSALLRLRHKVVPCRTVAISVSYYIKHLQSLRYVYVRIDYLEVFMRMLSLNFSLKTTSSRSSDKAGEASKLWLRLMEVICEIGMERR